MKPAEVLVVLEQILAGSRACDLESQQLEFKRDPATLPESRRAAKHSDELAQVLISEVVCFANADGGTIMVGVDDRAAGPRAFHGTDADVEKLRKRIYEATSPPQSVVIDEIELAERRLLAIRVPQGFDLVSDKKGAAGRRNGDRCVPLSEAERREIAHVRRNPDFTATVSARSWHDVHPLAIEEARRHLRRLLDLRSKSARLDDLSLLRSLGVVDQRDRLLVAGEILFCMPEHDSVDLLTRSQSGAEAEVRRIREPLMLVLPSVQALLRTSLDPEIGYIGLRDGQELTLPDFSPIAIDEAVTNALVHRDCARDDRVVVDHSPNALRVWSPGGLPPGVTTDRLLSTVSTPRNLQLMAAMQQLGLAERASRGIDRMYREQVRAGQRAPVYTTDEFHVEVVFHSGAPNRAFAGFIAGLPTDEAENLDLLLVLVHLCERPVIDSEQAAGLLQVEAEEAANRLDALVHGHGFHLQRDGDRRRGARWRLMPRTAAGLGTAVKHRARADVVRPQVEEHLREYGWITNRTIRNMFELDVQQARALLNELRKMNVVVKDPDGPERGPTVRWLKS